eukprot:TRINITY_DN16838_c0_g1_i1.p1 TRINITY_DN16838_c0_g1~~TRINITY_DN16838_c0_g1_i1.p1  ORF type:complete len:244 (+),score=42.21 TRINITY_DN16838_c0_g1_i1:58-732(+)
MSSRSKRRELFAEEQESRRGAEKQKKGSRPPTNDRLEYDDMEQIKERTRQENMEIKASLERADRTLQQTLGIANDTGNELKKQTEVIREIDGKIDYCNAELDEADVMINEIDSWWSMFNPFKKARKPKVVSKWGQTPEPPNRKKKGQERDLDTQALKTAEANVRSDTDMALDRMSKGLSVLKAQSKQMGDELDYQNNVLDKMNPKMQKLNHRLGKTSDRVQALA